MSVNSSAAPKKSLQSRSLILVKALITIILCGIIIWQGDWNKIWSAFRNANPFLIAVVFAGMLGGVAISAYKWQVVLSIHGIHYTFIQLQRYYYTSVFFNNFLPSNIGGDVYRIFQTVRRQPNRAGAVAAVVTERLTGIWALIALGAVGGTLVYFSDPLHPVWILPALSIFSAVTLMPLVLLIFSRRVIAWCLALPQFPQKLKNVLLLSEDYRRHSLKTLHIIGISFGFHLFTLAWMLLLAYAVGGHTSIHRLVLGFALCNLAALLPLSLNGIGLFDGSFIYVMVDLGMSFDAALMMMLVIRALLIVLSLIGGLFYLRDRKDVNVKAMRDPTADFYKEQA